MPLADEPGLGVLLMRPLGEGRLTEKRRRRVAAMPGFAAEANVQYTNAILSWENAGTGLRRCGPHVAMTAFSCWLFVLSISCPSVSRLDPDGRQWRARGGSVTVGEIAFLGGALRCRRRPTLVARSGSRPFRVWV